MSIVNPLVAKQLDSFQYADRRINIWEGSVRSSKTVVSLLRWLKYVRRGNSPAGNLVMVGKTERTLKRNVLDPLQEMIGSKHCRIKQGEGEVWILGRRIYLAGANDIKAEDRIRGLTLAGAYVDEISVLPEGFWSMLLTRLSIEGAQLFGTTNPDNPNHWLHRDYLKRSSLWIKHDGSVVQYKPKGRLDLARFSFRLSDNPSLSSTYVDALNAEFQGLYRLRYIEGLWVLAEGAIFDTFDPAPGAGYVVDQLPNIERWVVAIDYGTTNPFVALLIGLGADDVLYVASEWRWDSRIEKKQLTDAEYSSRLARWMETLDPIDNRVLGHAPGARTPDRIFVDPSAASFIQQLYRDRWVGVHGADNKVNDGIRNTNALLGRRLKIHRSCTGLLDEMTGYVWDKTAALKGIEQPLKINDHGPDALRYGVRGTRAWWRYWVQDLVNEGD